MKTGNAILGSFFLAMGFFYPMFLFLAIQKYNIDMKQLLPLPVQYFLVMLFAIFIALGILCIILGRDKHNIEKETEEEDEIDLFK